MQNQQSPHALNDRLLSLIATMALQTKATRNLEQAKILKNLLKLESSITKNLLQDKNQPCL